MILHQKDTKKENNPIAATTQSFSSHMLDHVRHMGFMDDVALMHNIVYGLQFGSRLYFGWIFM
jgi:hypothetical protein